MRFKFTILLAEVTGFLSRMLAITIPWCQTLPVATKSSSNCRVA